MTEPPARRRLHLFRGGYLVLLLSMLVLYLLQPIVEHHRAGRVLLLLLLVGVVVPGVLAASRHRSMFWTLLVLAVASLLGGTVEVAGEERGLWRVIPSTLFLAGATFTILADVLRSPRVTTDTVQGALCVYLLFGLFCGHVYFLAHAAAVGSFTLPEGETFAMSSCYYFSFVTLTTLGYGDIVPSGPGMRALATLEALLGQLYLVVLVARLVGIHITQTGDAERGEDGE